MFFEVWQVVERGLCYDAVNQDEPLPIFHVEIPLSVAKIESIFCRLTELNQAPPTYHCCELFSTGSIQDLKHHIFVVYFHLLTVAERWMQKINNGHPENRVNIIIKRQEKERKKKKKKYCVVF